MQVCRYLHTLAQILCRNSIRYFLNFQLLMPLVVVVLFNLLCSCTSNYFILILELRQKHYGIRWPTNLE